MKFSTWLENQETPEIIDSSTLTENDQRIFGNSAIVGDGVLVGYHVGDDLNKVYNVIKSNKKLTATYGKGRSRSAELGPGLYVSALPSHWMNRSTDKWSFLERLTPEQRIKLADKIKNDPVLVGKQYKDYLYKHVSDYEKERAYRDIDNWLKHGFQGMIVGLAGQPYNIKFWDKSYLAPLGIDATPKKPLLKVTFTGKFVNLAKHIGDFSYIAKMIRFGLDGGFVSGGIVSNPELCIWRKECIINYEEEMSESVGPVNGLPGGQWADTPTDSAEFYRKLGNKVRPKYSMWDDFSTPNKSKVNPNKLFGINPRRRTSS